MHPSKLVFGSAIAAAATLLSSVASAQPLASSPNLADKKPADVATKAIGEDTVGWEKCENVDWVPDGYKWSGLDLFCGTIWVPLDYSDPKGEHIRLRMTKKVAERTETEETPVFVNTGTAGPSNLFSSDGHSIGGGHLDVVAIEKRGASLNEPFKCSSSTLIIGRDMEDQQFHPDEAAKRLKEDMKFRKACAAANPQIARFMSAADHARDMDWARQAMGFEKINYYGALYGSMVGATYANMFPGHTRSFVLDNAYDPKAWTRGQGMSGLKTTTYGRLGITKAHKRTWEAMTAECDRMGDYLCAAAGTGNTDREYVLKSLLKGPRSWKVEPQNGISDGMRYSDVVSSEVYYFSKPDHKHVEVLADYYRLARLFRAQDALTDNKSADVRTQTAAEAPSESQLEALRKSFEQTRQAKFEHGQAAKTQGRKTQGQEFRSGLSKYQVLLGTVCSETRNPIDVTQTINSAREADKVFQGVGGFWNAVSSSCSMWPFQAKNAYRGDFANPSTPGVLVVASELNPRVPVEGSRTMFETIPNSRMLTVTDEYGALTAKTAGCANMRVTDYLRNPATIKPGRDLTCRSDRGIGFYIWDNPVLGPDRNQ